MGTRSPIRPLLSCLLVALASCNGGDPFGPPTATQPSFTTGGFVFTATASISSAGGRTLDYTVRVVNEGQVTSEVSILGGPCMLRPRLYSNQDGALAWSSFREDQACPDVLEVIELAPGAERLLTGSVEVDVDDGPYIATVTIEHIGVLDSTMLVELTAGLVTFQ